MTCVAVAIVLFGAASIRIGRGCRASLAVVLLVSAIVASVAAASSFPIPDDYP